MAADDWVHLSPEQLAADPSLADAIEHFQAPATAAGGAAERWLKQSAAGQHDHVATYLLIVDGEVAAFYSLGMSEVELRTDQRKALGAEHPRLGAVLILWLAKARNAQLDAATILAHAVGMAQIGARNVGAAVVAVDPYDAAVERLWRERFGFRASRTTRRDSEGEERPRLWMPLFPNG